MLSKLHFLELGKIYIGHIRHSLLVKRCFFFLYLRQLKKHKSLGEARVMAYSDKMRKFEKV